jgi:hypothetical protein
LVFKWKLLRDAGAVNYLFIFFNNLHQNCILDRPDQPASFPPLGKKPPRVDGKVDGDRSPLAPRDDDSPAIISKGADSGFPDRASPRSRAARTMTKWSQIVVARVGSISFDPAGEDRHEGRGDVS